MDGSPKPRRIVVISDFQQGDAIASAVSSAEAFRDLWLQRKPDDLSVGNPDHCVVAGGYLERLPLSCIRAGLADVAEIWTHWRGDHPPEVDTKDAPFLLRRSFRMNGSEPPFASNDMLGHILAFGVPDILCVWGLGVSEDILEACKTSYKIYNSIDAPALRVPLDVSRHFDLVITGAEWQSREVERHHPNMKTIVLPIGPEFASDTMFYPIGGQKRYEIVYVAAAQHYKRHDVLFDAMAKLPCSIRALCVFGYGEMGDALRGRASDLRIDVEFVGPPGVPFADVNRLMNEARIGVVCGVDDGAPAIITEYMLAGLPVLANADLRCGLQYITPKTGRAWPADRFHEGILDMLANLPHFVPRETVTSNWTWPHSIRKLQAAMVTTAV
jgi:glycosyltransferase involved in cell wall biosynthesis